MMGVTNPREAAPGTIRGDLGILFTENLVHGSDSLDSAEREIADLLPRSRFLTLRRRDIAIRLRTDSIRRGTDR